MKTIKLLIILIVTFTLGACDNQTKMSTESIVESIDESVSMIEVIDFHSTHRCMKCNAIEENTRYTLETYFAEEMRNGRITLQIINVDEDKNAQIAEKFEATGTSLFLNLINKGQEMKVDLTEFAFSSATHKEAFSESLKSAIEVQLKTL